MALADDLPGAAIFKETVTIEVTEPAVGRLREAAAVAADTATQLLADPWRTPGVRPEADRDEARAHAQRAIDRARFVHDQFRAGASRVTVSLPLEVLTGLVRVALEREEHELALALDPASVRDRSIALVALISLRTELEDMTAATYISDR